MNIPIATAERHHLRDAFHCRRDECTSGAKLGMHEIKVGGEPSHVVSSPTHLTYRPQVAQVLQVEVHTPSTDSGRSFMHKHAAVRDRRIEIVCPQDAHSNTHDQLAPRRTAPLPAAHEFFPCASSDRLESCDSLDDGSRGAAHSHRLFRLPPRDSCDSAPPVRCHPSRWIFPEHQDRLELASAGTRYAIACSNR